MPSKLYLNKSVLQALRERAEFIFDRFENIVISVSGGKDSTVLYDFFAKEAIQRRRRIDVFFLDQEAEYQATIDLMRAMMWRGEPLIVPHWYQVPIRMTNATSYAEDMLHAWAPGADWMRQKEARAVHDAPGAPDRFYPFFDWFERQWPRGTTCHLVGLRSEESLNRYRAVTDHAAIKGVPWSSKTPGGGVKLYPIYDWTFEDVWTYLGKFNVPYNRVYDWLWVKNKNIPELRVSNLIHEKAYRSLSTLQEFEHDTYDRLVRRLKGVHVAALYADEQGVFSTRQRPAAYKSWLAYRDFLLSTIPPSKAATFAARFARQPETESVRRQQCRQILLGDVENSLPVNTAPKGDKLAKWLEVL